MHHKRKRPKNRRAGCLMCKDWKHNGYGKRHRKGGERFSDHKRRYFAGVEIQGEHTYQEADAIEEIRLGEIKHTTC